MFDRSDPLFMARRLKSAGALALALAGLAAALPARADEDYQRERLARIAAELRIVQDMAEQARQAALSDPSGQVRFRYDWLERDLRMVRQGIQEHLDAPRQPRPVPPLRGDYRH